MILPFVDSVVSIIEVDIELDPTGRLEILRIPAKHEII
jgi:hypothetical protein